MPSAILRGLPNRFARRLTHFVRLEETAMLLPWNIHEHFHPVLLGQVEEPTRRHVIDPDEVRV
jgi:hypothetical protein